MDHDYNDSFLYIGVQSFRLKTNIKKLFKDQLLSGKLDPAKECHTVLDSKT